MIKTSIIIPTYNGKELLKDCLYTVKCHTETPYEIIVVDNGSTDGTADFCLKEEVLYVSAPDNLGFPAACNAGLRLATGDALLLLNNDVLVTPRWLSNMLACLYSDDRIGIVGPLTNYASGKQQIQARYVNLAEMAELFNRPNPEAWQQVDRIVGFCFLFKREMFERVGYFDERFSPGHYEDDDYCYRAKLAGYKLMIAGDVFVHHHGNASFGREEQEKIRRLLETNRQKFIEKWGIDPHQFI